MSSDLSDDERERLRSVTERAVQVGSEVAREFFRTDLGVTQKSMKMDTVTEADIAVQEAIVDVIRDSEFAVSIVGEEGDERKTVPVSGDAWVIDPIDGTNNFVRGNRLWAISVAYVSDGEPLESVTAVPACDDLYRSHTDGIIRNGRSETVSRRTDIETFIAAPVFGLKRSDRGAYERISLAILDDLGDLRRFGSGQTTLAAVACGELDAAISTVTLSPWDTIAGVHLVRQAGGRVTDPDGNTWLPDSSGLIASNGTRHEDLLVAVSGNDQG